MSVKVTVADLVGRSLELELPATETAKAIKDATAKSWGLDPATFRLLAQAESMDEEKTLESFLKEGQMEIEVQLLKFDPLLDLGKLAIAEHRGIEIRGPHVLKTEQFPDSNNVFLSHGIQEPPQTPSPKP